MTSKLVVNTIEADTGISSVSFASSISMNSTAKFHFSAAGVDIGADTNINRPAAGVLGFNISGAEKLRINSNGQVLIGTTVAPSDTDTKLRVHFSQNTSSGRAIEISHDTNGADKVGAAFGLAIANGGQSTNAADLYFSTASGGSLYERLRITSTGYIGINTSSPQYPLHVAGHTTDPSPDGIGVLMGLQHNHALIHLNAESDMGCIVDFSTPNTDRRGGILYYHSNNSVVANRDSMQFHTAGTERLRIASDGDVGIGTDNPTDILDINSDSASAVTNMYLRNHANLGGAALNIWTQGTYSSPTYKAIIGCSDAGGNIRMGAHSNHDLLLLTNNTERLRITSDGKVVINKNSGDIDGALHVKAISEDAITIEGNNAAINWRYTDGSAGYRGGIKWHSNGLVKFDAGVSGNSYYYAFHLNAAERMVIHAAGAVTKPYQYLFTVSTTNHSKTANWSHVTNMSPVAAQCTGVSDGTNWSNSTQRFTAPIAGVYHFFVGGWSYGNSNGARYAYCFKHTNGNNYTFIGGGDYCSGDSPMAGWSRTIKLSAGEWVELWGYSAISIRWGGGHHFFWGGYLLG